MNHKSLKRFNMFPDRHSAKIVKDHGLEWTDPKKGRFTGKYATEEGIRNLITDLWREATPDDLAATDRGRVVIAASSHVRINGEIHPDDVGFSGDRTKIREPTGEWGTPSVKTNLHIVRLGHASYIVLSDKSHRPEESTKSSQRLNVDAMRIQLKNLTGIASLMAGHFDLHEEFGAACLVEAGEIVTLCLNQVTCRSWLKQEHPRIGKIKWFDFNQVVLYFDGISVTIVSMKS